MNVNNSTPSNETFAWTSTWTQPVPFSTRTTLYSVLLVWSLVANVLVIAVVYCNQNLRTNMNYLIVNMAVSDLLVPLVAMPVNITWYATNGEWLVDGPFGEALCKLVVFLTELSPFVSSISLVIIAFQRFMAVVYPHRGQFLNRKATWIAISFPWIVAMALHGPFLYFFRLRYDYGYAECTYSSVFDITFQVIFYSIAAVVGFAVPLTVIIILYIRIIYKLRRSLDNVRGMMEKEVIRSRQKRNKRIFSMLITIVVMFPICWCPYITFILVTLHSIHGHIDFWLDYQTWHTLLFVFYCMWLLLAAVSPCIYFVFLKDFRQGLKRLCCRKVTSAIGRVLNEPGTEFKLRPQSIYGLTEGTEASCLQSESVRVRTSVPSINP